MSIIARDTPYGGAPFQTQPPEYEFPFLVNGDSTSFIVTRTYKQRIEDYNADRLAGRYMPGVDQDPSHPGAYLMTESKAAHTATALAQFTRTFARVPSPQVVYGSRVITKPAPASFGTSGTVLYQVTSSTLDVRTSLGVPYTYSTAVFGNNQVFAMKTAATTLTQPSGGTFTLTYKTSTTAALAYNASDATINAAINALADVVSDGLTFSATNRIGTWPSASGYISLDITVGSTTSRVTMNAASLTPAGASAAFTYVVTAIGQQIYIASRATIAAHGFTSTSDLVVSSGSTNGIYLLPDSQWNVIDANTIAFNWGLFNGATGSTPTSIGQYSRDYTPGTDRVGTRSTQYFYLPGVTPGVATASDIPLPDLLLNDLAFVNAVISSTSGFQTYDASELTRWNEGPIYTQTYEEINMANV